MHPVLQLLRHPTNVPPDLIGRIDEVWNRAIDDVIFLLNRQEYPGPDENCRKLIVIAINTDSYFIQIMFVREKCNVIYQVPFKESLKTRQWYSQQYTL